MRFTICPKRPMPAMMTVPVASIDVGGPPGPAGGAAARSGHRGRKKSGVSTIERAMTEQHALASRREDAGSTGEAEEEEAELAGLREPEGEEEPRPAAEAEGAARGARGRPS